jgi:hypothetical protein
VDTLSNRTSNEVKRALSENKVLLYAIESGQTKVKGKASIRGAKVLDELASITGGLAFHPDRPEDISAVIESIVAKIQD